MGKRRAGVLLHITSLPGDHGVGDLGPVARSFLDWFSSAGFSVWQLLPLGPTGLGDSPYLAASSFAGNALLISPDDLVAEGRVDAAALDTAPVVTPGSDASRVEFSAVRSWKERLLGLAFERFSTSAADDERAALTAFRTRQGAWLEDWALYTALKTRFGGRSWTDWDGPLRRREPEALATARQECASAIEREIFVQWLFDRQWSRLRREAHARGIRLFGDLPIYVAHDSADVWTRPELFLLDADGRPHVVAGVPPDAFSDEGQLWGNPLYDWRRHERERFAWWVARVGAQLERFDLLRIDHFRGFAGYWEVPAEARSAKAGRWRKAPGVKLLKALQAALDPDRTGLRLCAEDLGLITDDVEALRLQFDLPGMKVLQFGLGGPDLSRPGHERLHAPQHHTPRHIVYTGTHDNDTSEGWFLSLDEEAREWTLDAVGRGDEWLSWKLIRMAYASVAELAIVPLQDAIGLDSTARMNAPGVGSGNWSWRVLPEQIEPELAPRLKRLAELFGRI